MRRLAEINERMGVRADRGRTERPGDVRLVQQTMILRSGRIAFQGSAQELSEGIRGNDYARDDATSPRALLAWNARIDRVVARVQVKDIPDAVLRRAALVLADNISRNCRARRARSCGRAGQVHRTH